MIDDDADPVLSLDHPGWFIAADSEIYQSIGEGVRVEVRRHADGTLDEVVSREALVHLEQMSENHWWLGVGPVHIHFVSETTISAQLIPDGSSAVEQIDQETVRRWSDESKARLHSSQQPPE